VGKQNEIANGIRMLGAIWPWGQAAITKMCHRAVQRLSEKELANLPAAGLEIK